MVFKFYQCCSPSFVTAKRDDLFIDSRLHSQERIYRGPKASIPDFNYDDPREFARRSISLENIPLPDATERFKYQILLDHLKFEEAF